MTKEKQIEEMAKTLCIYDDGNSYCFRRQCDKKCKYGKFAKALYEAGYHKADKEEIDAIKRGMHFLLYSMCLQLNLGREIFVKYKIQLNNWFENYKKLKKIGAKMNGKEIEEKK